MRNSAFLSFYFERAYDSEHHGKSWLYTTEYLKDKQIQTGERDMRYQITNFLKFTTNLLRYTIDVTEKKSPNIHIQSYF